VKPFDPYHRWLGIPPGFRPPTHYQLLGVSPAESDPEVIHAAALRQSAFVRNFQSGAHAEAASRILSELAEARAVLTDPARREQYDALLSAAAPSGPRPVATPAPDEPADPDGRGFRFAPTSRPPRRTTATPYVLAGAAVVLLALAAGGFVLTRSSRHQTPVREAADATSQQAAPAALPKKPQTQPSHKPVDQSTPVREAATDTSSQQAAPPTEPKTPPAPARSSGR
jgi:curved DNA-binding protein CbpA